MSFRRFSVSLTCAALAAALTAACAPSTDLDDPVSGSALDPTFQARKDGAHRGGRPGKSARPSHRSRPPASASTSGGSASSSAVPAVEGSGDGSGDGGDASTAPTAPTTLRASLVDDAGDVSGLGSPAYVDLRGVTLERTGDRFRLVVETAATLPTKQEGDPTMNVVGFADTDLDGSIDYEVWATLSDSGWSPSSRSPGGARFGSASGVSISVSGSRLTMTFGAGILGGAERFQWSTGTEYGTYEQIASGTTAQDYGPDNGATRFPG